MNYNVRPPSRGRYKSELAVYQQIGLLKGDGDEPIAA